MFGIYAQPVVDCVLWSCQTLRMDNLARIRSERGLTQTQLAEAVQANQATISKIESGRGNPTLDLINRIASALNVHPSALFSRDALEERALTALDHLIDEKSKEAAVIVLESMAQRQA